jgi:hypothetical protein
VLSRLDAKATNFRRLKCLWLIRLVLASHICSMNLIPWFHTWVKKGPLTTMEDLSACNPNQHWYTYIPSTKTFERRTWGRLGTTWEDFKTIRDLLEHLLASWWFKYYWRLSACSARGCLGTTHRGLQEYLSTYHSSKKVLGGLLYGHPSAHHQGVSCLYMG